MSLLKALFSNKTDTIEEAFRARDCTSDIMEAAIKDWFNLFYLTHPVKGEDPCQRIPYTVVNKITKTALAEYKATSKDEFATYILEALYMKRKEAIQAALIGGEAFLKPIITPNGLRFTVIPRINYAVFGRDAEGNPDDIGTAEKTVTGKYYYTLLERRTVGTEGLLTIENRLYRSDSNDVLGSRVQLTELEKYAALQDVYTFSQPMGLGLAQIKTPLANCVDGSPDGVSIYAPAVGLIHNINRNEAELNGEFERGESRIIVSSDMLTISEDGKRNVIKDNVFTGLDDNPEDVGITIFSPTLREQSFLARKAEYLRNVENIIGLKRGLLTEVEAAERTATEITSSAGDYNLTIIDFQQMWEAAVKSAVQISGTVGQMYRMPGAKPIDPDSVVIDWGNGILYDEEKTWADYKAMVASGLLKPEIAVAWYFGMPFDTEAQLEEVRKRYMPEIESLMTGGEE